MEFLGVRSTNVHEAMLIEIDSSHRWLPSLPNARLYPANQFRYFYTPASCGMLPA